MRSTLDTLAFDTEKGDDRRRARLPRAAHLIARAGTAVERSAAILSHPQPLAQCAGFLREHLPGVERRSVSSTAEAVRMVGESVRPWAAIGARAAAELYGCDGAARGDRGRGRQRHPLRLDRPGRHGARGRGPWRTSLVFSELGADHPGALVEALQEFSGRDVNLSRIESRPLRQGLGRYMFFCDLEGAVTTQPSQKPWTRCGRRPSRCGCSVPTRSTEAGVG